MAKVRQFNKYNDRTKVLILMGCLMNAFREHPEFYDVTKHRTDLLGIATQYSKFVRREDFDLIKDMKIEDIINMFNEGWK